MNQLPNDASKDQSNCPDGYYRRSNGMVMQLPRAEPQQSAPDLSAQAHADAIDLMTHDELKTLVRRLLCQCGAVARMTDEETAQAMLDVLAETALKPVIHGTSMKADITARLTAVERWLDRKKGKPIGTSPMVQIGSSGDINVMIRLVDAQGNVEVIEG